MARTQKERGIYPLMEGGKELERIRRIENGKASSGGTLRYGFSLGGCTYDS